MGGWDAEVEGSHVEVRLEDGRSFVAHACVGCDGIHSRMRRFVSGTSWTPLRYLGYIVVLGIFENASFPLTQRRAFQTSDGRARLFAMPFTAELSMWQLSWAMPEEEAVAVSKSTDLLRAAALQVSSFSHDSSLY
jgi:2-polyprenyl-6-methoxyphenol hydroxylase-like FAD-dependent oxidoreductase